MNYGNNNTAPPPYSPPGVPPPTTYPRPEQNVNPPRQENRVIITNGPMVIGTLGQNSEFITCPYCFTTITTKVVAEPSTKTHLVAFLMCLLGCWPCCILPYCMDACQSKSHFCPNCNAYLASSYDD